jgi:hypothetical protein
MKVGVLTIYPVKTPLYAVLTKTAALKATDGRKCLTRAIFEDSLRLEMTFSDSNRTRAQSRLLDDEGEDTAKIVPIMFVVFGSIWWPVRRSEPCLGALDDSEGGIWGATSSKPSFEHSVPSMSDLGDMLPMHPLVFTGFIFGGAVQRVYLGLLC